MEIGVRHLLLRPQLTDVPRFGRLGDRFHLLGGHHGARQRRLVMDRSEEGRIASRSRCGERSAGSDFDPDQVVLAVVQDRSHLAARTGRLESATVSHPDIPRGFGDGAAGAEEDAIGRIQRIDDGIVDARRETVQDIDAESIEVDDLLEGGRRPAADVGLEGTVLHPPPTGLEAEDARIVVMASVRLDCELEHLPVESQTRGLPDESAVREDRDPGEVPGGPGMNHPEPAVLRRGEDGHQTGAVLHIGLVEPYPGAFDTAILVEHHIVAAVGRHQMASFGIEEQEVEEPAAEDRVPIDADVEPLQRVDALLHQVDELLLGDQGFVRPHAHPSEVHAAASASDLQLEAVPVQSAVRRDEEMDTGTREEQCGARTEELAPSAD